MIVPPYVFSPEDEMVAEWAEYSGLPMPRIAEALSDFRRLNSEEWNATEGRSWEEKAERFYGASRHYVYDLLRANPSRSTTLANLDRFEPRIMATLRSHPGRTFLDFGGGIGVICQVMAGLGKEVTYLDLPGAVAEFAAWRFRKHGLAVERIVSGPRSLVLDGSFDLIFSDAVFEHLIDPLGVARRLAACLNPGGFFALLVDLEGHTAEMPMHRDVDIAAIHGALEESGLTCAFGRNVFASGWSRP